MFDHLEEPDYLTWLEIHTTVLGEYRQQLLNAVSDPDLTPEERAPRSLLLDLKNRQPPRAQDLLDAHLYLHECERRLLADPSPVPDPRRHPLEHGGGYWLLVDTCPGPVARAYRSSRRFKLGGELGAAKNLGLRFHWRRLPSGLGLDLRELAELEGLSLLDRVKVGLAPFAGLDDLQWIHDPDRPHRQHGYYPLRCTGADSGCDLTGRLEALLKRACETGVHLLLLPELCVDESLLKALQAWLKTHNLPDPRLRLVVAGSHHHGGDSDFRNRATVLGQDGRVLWEQDKLTHFNLPASDFPGTPFATLKAPGLYEPFTLGEQLVLRDSCLGRLAVAVCIDLFEFPGLEAMGVDGYLTPAMSPGLSRFTERARKLGGVNGAFTLVANARRQAPPEERVHAYLPTSGKHGPAQMGGTDLFILEIHKIVNK